MKPLFIPLKTEYFEAFKAGTKTVEYRPYGPRWNEGTCVPGRDRLPTEGNYWWREELRKRAGLKWDRKRGRYVAAK